MRFGLTAMIIMSAGCGDRLLTVDEQDSGPTADGPAAVEEKVPNKPPPPPEHGCNTNADCGGDQFCRFERGCNPLEAGGLGRCEERPPPCTPAMYDYVCGCDGETYGAGCLADAAGVNVAHRGSCTHGEPACLDVECALINACCQCQAVDVSQEGPGGVPCPDICEAPRCSEWALVDPFAYCVGGQCIMGDAAPSCKEDDDCMLVDDCHECAAYPWYATPPGGGGTESDCESRCRMLGLQSARARCVDGVCRLVL